MSAFPHIRSAALSDVGLSRSNNEDAYGVFPEMGIYCVADGMGGGDDGEIASNAIVEAIGHFALKYALPAESTYPINVLISGIRQTVNAVSSRLEQRTREKRLKGCGSTFVCICFDASNPKRAVVLHAGDSRLYLIRGRSIRQVTKDHSPAELLGVKSENDINPTFRGMVLRAVGLDSTVDLERTDLKIKAGDRILICSDGLTRGVDDQQICALAHTGMPLEESVHSLVAAANAAGGVDNVTVELIEIGLLPPPRPAVISFNGTLARQVSESGSVETRDTERITQTEKRVHDTEKGLPSKMDSGEDDTDKVKFFRFFKNESRKWVWAIILLLLGVILLLYILRAEIFPIIG